MVGPQAGAFHPTTESFLKMAREEEERVAQHEVLKSQAEEEWIHQNYLDLQGPDGGIRTAPLSQGTGVQASGPRRVVYRGIRVRYVGHLLGYDGPPLETTQFGDREDGGPNTLLVHEVEVLEDG
jgi:hypothetical protein